MTQNEIMALIRDRIKDDEYKEYLDRFESIKSDVKCAILKSINITKIE